MKLNNKGVTIIELVLSFAVLMIIVYGMFNVVVEIKSYSEDKKIEQELTEYKNRITYLVQDDLIKKGFKSYSNCSSSNYIKCINITFNDSTTRQLKVDMENKIITYNDIEYEIPYKNLIEFVDSSIISLCSNSAYSTRWDCVSAGETWSGGNNHEIYSNINFDNSNSIFTIEIPYFITDKATTIQYYDVNVDKDYGIKIVHPYGLD